MDYTISKGDTLSSIAQKNNTTVSALSSLNKITDPNKIIAGQSIKLPGTPTTQSTLPNTSLNAPINQPTATPPTINAGIIGTTPAIQLPTVNVSSYKDLPGGITENTLSDGTKSYVQYSKNADGSLTPREVPKPTENFALSQLAQLDQQKGQVQQYSEKNILEQLGIIQGLSGESQALTQAQEEEGVFRLKQEYKDIADRISARQAFLQEEYKAINASPMSFAARAGYESAIQARAESEILSLNAEAQAIAGRYDMAVDTAQRAVDAKYKPQKERLQLLKDQLEAIKPLLTEEQAQRAQKREQLIKQEERQYQKAEAEEKSVSEIAYTIAKNSAPQSLVNKALQAKTQKELMAIPGISNYLLSPVEKLDRDLKTLALRKARAELGTTSTQVSAKDIPLVVAQTEDKINRIKNLKKDSYALNASTGSLRAIAPGVPEVLDWRANVKNLLADLELDELGRVKVSGVTFGQLSNGEREAVGRAATAIKAAQVGEKGRFRMSEEEFVKNLNTIQKLTELDFERRVGVPFASFESQLKNVTEEEYADNLINGGNPYSAFEE